MITTVLWVVLAVLTIHIFLSITVIIRIQKLSQELKAFNNVLECIFRHNFMSGKEVDDADWWRK